MDSGSPIDELYRRYLKSKAPKDLAPVFQKLAPRLLTAARRSGLDAQGAEDVVQETFLAVIEAEDRFDPERSFLGWVQGIALRQIRAERRRRARLQSLLQPDREEEAAELEGPDPAAASVTSTEFQRKVEDAILALTEGNRKVVRAALFEGLSIDEIAERFDLSKGAVSVRLHRGLSRLRARLKDSSTLAVVALSQENGQGLEAVWERLLRRVSPPSPAKAAAPSVLSTGGLLVGALLLAALGTSLWLVAGQGDAGSSDTSSDARSASAVAEAERSSPSERALKSVATDTSSAEEDALRTELPTAPARPNDSRDLRGVVVARGVAGAPEGAQIFLLESDPGLVLPDAPMQPVATTDKDGVYWLSAADLDVDSTPILVVRHGTEIGWVDVPGTALSMGTLPELNLVPELVIAATVVDDAGRPIEGARLSAWTQVNRFMAQDNDYSNQTGVIPTRRYQFLFGGATDKNGLGLVKGLYGADSPGLVIACAAWKSGYTFGMVAMRLSGGRRVELTITLLETKNLSLRGRVVDERGDPIASANASILLRGESDAAALESITTGMDGEWEIPNEFLDDYPLQIQFSAEGFASRRHYTDQAQELPTDPVVIALPSASALSGRVVDEKVRPLAGAGVTIAVAGDFQDLTTNAEGEFQSAPRENAPALITVTMANDQGAQRSATFPMDAGEGHKALVVPGPRAYAKMLRLRLPTSLGKGGWIRAQLQAQDVEGFVGALPASELDGDDAIFKDVPMGRWLCYGLTEEGAQPLEEFTIEAEAADEAESVLQLDKLDGGGSINWVLETLPEGAGSTSILLARRRGLPRLPGWMQVRAGGLRRELMLGITAESPVPLSMLLPGEWEVSAAGDGWRTQTALVVVKAGESARVDLQPESAHSVSFVAPATASAGLMSIEVRQHADQPWNQVGLIGVSPDIEMSVPVQLPKGSWSWRARLQTIRSDENFVDMIPPAYGAVAVHGKEEVKVHLSSASLRPE